MKIETNKGLYMKRYIIGLDEGTTSARTVVYDLETSKIISAVNEKFKQYFPKPGWVEHDASEIWRVQEKTMYGAIKEANIDINEIIGIGITNQRESVVAWNRTTGEPICPSIVWQCRRTAKFCDKIDSKMRKYIKDTTGLIVDPYFSATKIKWILDNVPEAKKLLKCGNLCIGTIDSFLMFKLTKGKRYITDHSNASRTMLYNIKTLDWDDKLLKYFGIPREILPTVTPNGKELGMAHTKLGDIPVGAILGDQQSSLFGLGCVEKGLAKATYGTGCFILSNTGDKLIQSDKLLSTIAWNIDGKVTYALEGSIFNAGTIVNWLIDDLKVLASNKESSEICYNTPSTEGVYFVPAFTGMGAPYWNPYCKGSISGITRGTKREHIIRAGLESMAYNLYDIVDCMKTSGTKVSELRVDGGVSRNDFLMQFQSDMLNKKVVKTDTSEGTVLGTIYMTALSLGYIKTLEDVKNKFVTFKEYNNQMNASTRKELLDGWHKAIKKVISEDK